MWRERLMNIGPGWGKNGGRLGAESIQLTAYPVPLKRVRSLEMALIASARWSWPIGRTFASRGEPMAIYNDVAIARQERGQNGSVVAPIHSEFLPLQSVTRW